MGTYHDVHIRPLVPEADLLEDLADGIGVAPERHTDGGEGFVVGFEGVWLDIILDHDLEDDQGLLFSQYPYYITVRNRDLEQEVTREIARDLYRLLIGTGHWECFIVWNDSVLVDPATPAAPGTQ